jgi:hypothetical protein
MKRAGKISAVITLAGFLIVLAVALAAAPGAAAEHLSPAERRAQESVLRLAELPRGYVLGEDFYCGAPPRPSEEEGIFEREEHKPPTPYEAFLDRNDPGVCFFGYDQLYRPAGEPERPEEIASFTFVLPSAAAAAEALTSAKISKELATYITRTEGFYPIGSPPPVGEASLLFHTNLFHAWRRTHLAGSLVLWRNGNVIAGTYAAGAKIGIDDAAATHYAALQQALVVAPRPYEEAEAEDIPTWLGNPNLTVPVYWLGREFKPGHGLGTSYFLALWPHEHVAYPRTGVQMSVQYNTALWLDSWTPAGWRRFAKTEVGRRQWTWHCTRSQTLQLPEGHAVIYAAYKKDYETCPSFAPHHFSAHVFLPGAVIAIGEADCRYCQGELDPSFGSFPAMKAIVRGLRRWRPVDVG